MYTTTAHLRQLSFAAQGMVLPTVDWALDHQLAIKAVSHRQANVVWAVPQLRLSSPKTLGQVKLTISRTRTDLVSENDTVGEVSEAS